MACRHKPASILRVAFVNETKCKICGEDIRLNSHELIKANIFSILLAITCFVTVILYSLEYGNLLIVVILGLFVDIVGNYSYFMVFAKFNNIEGK